MIITAIIAEYNPIHKGHIHHIKKTISETGADAIVVIMSSSFVQRGEPAIVDKFTRAQVAIHCGADLVLELPTLFSLQSAEGFARGAVEILSRTGVVDYLSFGSDSGDLSQLELISERQVHYKKKYEQILRSRIKEGYSYSVATDYALKSILPESLQFPSPGSNDILALEYLKALRSTDIKPVAIQREGSYLSERLDRSGYASATAIRRAILHDRKCPTRLRAFLPDQMIQSLLRFHAERGRYGTIEGLRDPLLYLYSIQRADLSNINCYENGLENLLRTAMETESCLSDAVTVASSKRYKQSRLRRFLLSSLLNIRSSDVQDAMRFEDLYIRPLAFSETGVKVLKRIKQVSALPVVSKFSDEIKRSANPHLLREAAATGLYELPFPKPSFSADYTISPKPVKRS